MPVQHFPWAASAAYRHMACAGALALSRTVPESPSSIYAAEGTVAHELIAKALTDGEDPRSHLNKIIACEGFDILVDEDLVVAIEECVAYRRTIPEIKCEVPVSLEAYGLPIESGGTSDSVGYDVETQTLEIEDDKMGAGVAVEVVGNVQLRHYALGALAKEPRPVKQIRITISQPRAIHPDGPIRSEDIDPVDLMLDFLPTLREAMDRAVEAQKTFLTDMSQDEWSKAFLSPGDHCRFCPASAVCPALKSKAIAVIEQHFDYFGAPIPLTMEVSPEEIATDLDRIELVEQWISARRTQAHAVAQRGIEIPGWGLVEKIGHRKWLEKDDFRASVAIAAAIGIDDPDKLFDRKLKSPAGVEKMRGVKKSDLEGLFEKPVIGADLVRSRKARNRKPAETLVQQFFITEE